MDVPFIKTTVPTIDQIYYILKQSNSVYDHYKELIDSYVLDFFTCSHWDTLPPSWKNYLGNLSPKELSDVLNYRLELKCSRVAPLSLIALRYLIHHLCIPRSQLENVLIRTDRDSSFKNDKSRMLSDSSKYMLQDTKVMKLFWKNVKIKKRYELTSFAKYTYEMAQESNCDIIVDVGAGLGHLCRLLSYGYGMQVIGIDAQDQLVQQAKKLDEGLERLALKYNPNFRKYNKYSPCHLKFTIKENLHQNKFLEIIKLALNLTGNSFKFGIIGLHPCGDLGPILLRLYKNCPNVQFVNIVGCCYMKLSSGYPLSGFCIENQYKLSYHAREIACHAMEIYVEKLKSGKCWELKVHAFRATLEKILSEKYPHLKHTALSNVKYTPETSFLEYCQKALKKLDVVLTEEDISSEEIQKCLDDWKRVVTFYTIRLLFAPLIETLIILDRLLYICPDGYSMIDTIFDPRISPRNFVITGLKKELH